MVACIFGTFVISLLVVFLNNLISFDEVENHIYNSILENQDDNKKLKKLASELILKGLLISYLKAHKRESTRVTRVGMLLDMAYDSKEFKIFKM